MTPILAINDNHHGSAVTRIISLSASVAAATRVAGPFILTWERRVTANRYVCLAAFSVIMTLTTMVFAGVSFQLAFNPPSQQIVRPFTAAH